MAKATGFIKIEGSLEGLTFYKKDGVYYVRKKGGISKERIHKEPNFERTRENNSEFGHCGTCGKVLRTALAPMVIKAKDTQLQSRLLSVLLRIKNMDTVSPRGQRTVARGMATAEGKSALKGFNFNANALLSNVLHADYNLNVETGTLSITALRPAEQINYPAGATHVSFQSAVCALDFETLVSEVAYSTAKNVPLNLTPIAIVLTPTSMPSGTGQLFFVLMLSFYQEVNGVQYALKDDKFNVLGIVEVV
ncbi:hypothetical protein [Flavobacterium pedocola]